VRGGEHEEKIYRVHGRKRKGIWIITEHRKKEGSMSWINNREKGNIYEVKIRTLY